MTDLIKLFKDLFAAQTTIRGRLRALIALCTAIDKLLESLGIPLEQEGQITIRLSFATSEEKEAYIQREFGALERPLLDIIRYIIENPEQLQKLIQLIMTLLDMFGKGASQAEISAQLQAFNEAA